MSTNKHVRIPIKMGKLFSLWVAMVLVIILSLSAVMIVWQKSRNEVSTIDTQPSSQYFWRDSNNKNTHISLDSIQDMLLDSRLSLRNADDSDEYDIEMWQALSELQSRYNSDMWRDVYASSMSDFISYQTEEIKSIPQEYKDEVRNEIESQGQKSILDFVDSFIFGDVSNLDFSNIDSISAQFANENFSSRMVYIPTIPAWAMAVLEGAYEAAVWIVSKASWWVPTFITVGLVLIALGVMTAIIITYWSEIKDFFSSLVNDFVSRLGKVADAVRNFFNNILNQARDGYKIVVGGVDYFADVSFTASNLNQYKTDNFYLLLLKGSDMYIAPNSVSQMVATMALRINNNNGTYNSNQEKAFTAALDAGNGAVRKGGTLGYTLADFEVAKSCDLNIRLNHYHPATSNAHSFFGSIV